MKKIKFFAAAIAFCGASLLGYNAYSNATMTEQERLIQQNLEALTSGETSDGYSSVTKTSTEIPGQGVTITLVCLGSGSLPCA